MGADNLFLEAINVKVKLGTLCCESFKHIVVNRAEFDFLKEELRLSKETIVLLNENQAVLVEQLAESNRKVAEL